MNAVFKTAAAVIFLLTVGCGAKSDKFRSPLPWSKCATRAISNEYLVKHKTLPLRKLHLSQAQLNGLLKDPQVEWIEPNYKIVRQEVGNFQGEDENSMLPNAERIHAEYAWQRGIYGNGIKIAVIDSGIDTGQIWLQTALQDTTGEWGIAPVPNGIDDDHNGYVDDIFGWNFIDDSPRIVDETGHGTHVAGVIAASANSGFSLEGVAPGVTLIAADFMNSDSGDEFHALKAIEYSIHRGAKIINNSWSSLCSYSLVQAFNEWQNLNVIFVNAAGNEGVNIDSVEVFPSNLHLVNAITVGSVGADLRRSKFSNYGRNVVVFAPGENIYGLVANDEGVFSSISRSGTSLSTPFVSGGLALAWSAYPKLKAAEIVRAVNLMARQSLAKSPFFNIPDLFQELDREAANSAASP
jgi:subtilisin family serine protease